MYKNNSLDICKLKVSSPLQNFVYLDGISHEIPYWIYCHS